MTKYSTEKHIQPKNAFKILLYRKKTFANCNFWEKCPILSVFNMPASFDNVSRELKEIFYFRYEEHNELVKKTIPKENLLIWNLKDGWEPLCTFLDVPIPDVPIPRENTTGDFKWAEEYFYQDKVTRNGIKYFVGYCILIIVILFCVIFFPIKYA